MARYIQKVTQELTAKALRAENNDVAPNNATNITNALPQMTKCNLPDFRKGPDGNFVQSWVEKSEHYEEVQTSGWTSLAIKMIYDDIMDNFDLDPDRLFLIGQFNANVLWYGDCSVGTISQWDRNHFTGWCGMDWTQTQASINIFSTLLEDYNLRTTSISRDWISPDKHKIILPQWAGGTGSNWITVNELDKEVYDSILDIAKEVDAHPKDMYNMLITGSPAFAAGLKDWFNKGKLPGEAKMTWKEAVKNDWKQLTRTDAAFKKGATGIKGWRPFKAFTPSMFKTGPTPLFRKIIKGIVSPLLIGLEVLLFSKPLNDNENFLTELDYDQQMALLLVHNYYFTRSKYSELWIELGGGDNDRWNLENSAINIFKASHSLGYYPAFEDYFQCYRP